LAFILSGIPVYLWFAKGLKEDPKATPPRGIDKKNSSKVAPRFAPASEAVSEI
jgi:hypothetical protein